MNLSAPLSDVSPGVGGALLQTLARLERPVTRRHVAMLSGVAPGYATGVIDDLVSAGLVTDFKAGRASMVSLNRQHLAAASIVALAGLRGELIRRLRERLADWPDLVGAWLFGSVARGEATRDSDIDLLIVATELASPDLHQRIGRLQTDTESWTGNELQLVEHSPVSWSELRRAGNPLVEQIRLDGIALTTNGSTLLERDI